MDHVPRQVNYKTFNEYSPKYRFQRVPLNNFSSSGVSLTPTGQQVLEFKLPVCAYNLSRSQLCYEIDVPAFASNYGIIHDDTFTLGSSIYFGTGSGTGIVQLDNCNNYVKIARQIWTERDDYLTNDDNDGLYPEFNSQNFNPPNNYPFFYNTSSGNMYGLTPSLVSNLSLRADEPRHYYSNNSLDTPLSRSYQYPLSAFKQTLFATDVDLYWPLEMYIRVLAGPGSKMAFYTTNNVTPFAGTPVNCPTINLNNIYLYLAVEQNEILVDSIMEKVKGGSFSLTIPFTNGFRTSSSTTNIGYQISLTRQYGKYLKHMIFSAFNGGQTSSNTAVAATGYAGEQNFLAYDNNNWNNSTTANPLYFSKISSYTTYLDNRPLTDYQISTQQPLNNQISNQQSVSSDWRENSRFCKNSALSNYGMYQLNWFHMDSFVDSDRTELDDNIEAGLDMSTQHTWLINANASVGNGVPSGTAGSVSGLSLVLYNWACFTRTLHIAPSGPPILD